MGSWFRFFNHNSGKENYNVVHKRAGRALGVQPLPWWYCETTVQEIKQRNVIFSYYCVKPLILRRDGRCSSHPWRY